MANIVLIVDGDPMAFTAHRYDHRHGGHVFNPQSRAKKQFQEYVRAVLGNNHQIWSEKSLFKMEITFMMQRPLHHFINSDRERGLKVNITLDEQNFTLLKRDLDNMVKFVLDGLQGIVY